MYSSKLTALGMTRRGSSDMTGSGSLVTAFPPRDHPFSRASALSLGAGLGSTGSEKTAVAGRKAGVGAKAEADARIAATMMTRCHV